MAVMAVADTAKFDLMRQLKRRYDVFGLGLRLR